MGKVLRFIFNEQIKNTESCIRQHPKGNEDFGRKVQNVARLVVLLLSN
jgi:hypothetical protein